MAAHLWFQGVDVAAQHKVRRPVFVIVVDVDAKNGRKFGPEWAGGRT